MLRKYQYAVFMTSSGDGVNSVFTKILGVRCFSVFRMYREVLRNDRLLGYSVSVVSVNFVFTVKSRPIAHGRLAFRAPLTRGWAIAREFQVLLGVMKLMKKKCDHH